MSSRTLAFLLIALTLAGFGSLMGLRDSLSWLGGDEGTYSAMAESLAYDGDLVFSAADRERIEDSVMPGARELILQRTTRGITYSKPVLYPLAASPFVKLLGAHGLVVCNILALGAALWLALLFLLRLGSAERAVPMLLTFACASVLLPYLAWRMSDALLVSCTLAGLVLSLGGVRKAPEDPRQRHRDDLVARMRRFASFLDRPWAPAAGGALLGLAAFMRYPNALLAVAALVSLLLLRRWERAAFLLLGVALAAALAVGLSIRLTGVADPYRAPRATFTPATGYPDGPDSEIAQRQLGGQNLATVRLYTDLRPRVIAYSSLYFLIGRHTGMLIYFPAALLLAVLALRRPDRTAIVLVGSAAGIVLFYLLLLPHNYFGGGSAVGNRYFLAAYPALLVAQSRLPRRRWTILPWAVAAAALVSALISVWQTRPADRTSQAHAYAGIFRILPFESTLQSIEGSKERFWLHDWGWEMLHFNDPYQRLGSFSFLLETGQPPTEIEVANRRPRQPLRFLVASGAPRLTLDYRDWGRSETIELERPFGERGLVEIEPSPAWRRHPFWFFWLRDEVFTVRLFRLSIRTPDASPAVARLRYLGPAEIPRDIYSREVLSAELPTLAGAGTISVATVRVRNTSSETWQSDRVLAVMLSYKLFHRSEQGVKAIEGGRTPLPGAIPPGEEFEAEIEIGWPPVPRNYGLAIDLVHEGIAWFEEHNGSPLARSEVKVVSLPKAEPLSVPEK